MEVITNVFFPSYSILFIRPAPVRFSRNFESLECDRFAFVSRDVVLMPSWPDCWVASSRSATICMLVLYDAICNNTSNSDISVLPSIQIKINKLYDDLRAMSLIPWFDDFVGVAYRYYDLRMNVAPLFTDRRDAASLWYNTIHPWVDPSIKIRFLEIDDKYWFIMGSDSQRPSTNVSFFKELSKSENYERFKKGHDGEAYLRLGIYADESLADAKKDAVCSCGHDAQDHDEGDGDICLFNSCDCKRFSSFQLTLLKKKKIITDIKFLKEGDIQSDPLVWNCINANRLQKPD